MHLPGIEPGLDAWRATIIPLEHKCLIIFYKKSFDYFIKFIKNK